MDGIADVPMNFLVHCSDAMLRDFALQALNRAANLKKARNELNDEVAQWEGKAWLAEWLIVRRAEFLDSLRTDGLQKPLDLGGDSLRDVQPEAAAANGPNRKIA